jgi:hypothetical protein
MLLMRWWLLVLSLLPPNPQLPAGWEQTSLRAERLMADGKAAQAIELLERTLTQSPGVDAVEYTLGKAHQLRAGQLILAGSASPTVWRGHLEQAATLYRQAASRKGQYRQPALGGLIFVYEESGLDRPSELATAAREYVAGDPGSAMGHVALADGLRASGRQDAAWAALDAACAVVHPDRAAVIARAILVHLADALPTVPAAAPVDTTVTPPPQLARLLDYVDRAVAQQLAADPSDREARRAKAAALLLRAQRLEGDPTKRQALESEVDGLLGLTRVGSGTGPTLAFARPEGSAPADTPTSPAAVEPAAHRIEAIVRTARQVTPATYDSRYGAAVRLEELVRKDTAIATADATRAFTEALAFLDEALALKPGGDTGTHLQVARAPGPGATRPRPRRVQGAHRRSRSGPRRSDGRP